MNLIPSLENCSQSDSDWCWLVSDEVLQVASGHVGVHELEKAIGVGLLSESHGDWGWLVGNKVLKVSSGHVGIHKLEEAIGVRLIELNEGLGDWSIGILNQVNEGGLGHVLTVELSNLGLSSVVLLGPVGGLVINGVVSIIIWETLVEDILEGLATSEGISNMGSGSLWDSLDHDGKGDVVVVGDVLLLISGSLKDRVEGVISNNLSERLEGDGLNNILGVGWVNLEGDGLDFINWDIGSLSEGIEWISLGSNKVGLGWDSGNTSWGVLGLLFVVVLVVMLVVGLRLTFQLGIAGFFKVSFLSLGASVALVDKLIKGGLDHVLDLIMGIGLGTLARLSEGLLHSVGKGTDLSIDLGIGVRGLLTLNSLNNIGLLEGE